MGSASYIIRIYRRDDSDPCMMVGIVEDTETDLKQRFTSFEELKRILGAPKSGPPRERKDSLTKKPGR